MKRRFFAIITAMAVAASACPVYAQALVSENTISEDESPVGAVDTEVSEGTCGENLTWKLVGDDRYGHVLTISGSGEMDNYNSSTGSTTNSAPWGEYSEVKMRLVIEPGVESIGSWAFSNMTLVGGLTIPDSVKIVRAGAFYDAGIHGKLGLGKSISSLGDNAFMNCYLTGNLVVPGNIKVIGKSVFSKSYDREITRMGKIVLEDGIEIINENAFYRAGKFTSGLTLPDSVRFVGDSCFEANYFDGDVKLSKGMTSINKGAFAFDSDGSLYIPEGIISIGENAFLGNTGFRGDIIIPDSVTSIGTCAFADTGFDGNLKLSSNLRIIGLHAFSGSDISGTLELPAGLETIRAYAFLGVDNMTGDVIIPDSVTRVSDMAFAGNSGMRGRLVIPSSVTGLSYDVAEYSGFTVIENNSKEVVALRDEDESFFFGSKWTDINGNELYRISEGTAYRVEREVKSATPISIEAYEFFLDPYAGDPIDKSKIEVGVEYLATFTDEGPTESFGKALKPYEFELDKTKFEKGMNIFTVSFTDGDVTLTKEIRVIAKAHTYFDEYYVDFESEGTVVGNLTMVNGGKIKRTEAKKTSADRREYKSYSSDKSVAVISKSGEIKAVGEGCCTISVEKADKTYVYNVTVTDPGFKSDKKLVNSGDIFKLDFEGTDLKVKYSIPKKQQKVATIDEDGVITAKRKGVATVTASVGGKKYKAKVYIYNPSIKAIKSNVISVGKSKTLKVINGAKGTKWISENPAIATVSASGKVTGVSAGRVRILAYNNGIELSKDIVVN